MTAVVTVIVVTYNSANVLRLCLSSLVAQTYPQFEVVIVDNASVDDTCAIVEKEFPKFRLIRNSNNPGFAAANNQAMRQTSGEFIALINPDVELHPDWIAEAVACARMYADIGVVGSKVFYSNRIVLQHVGGMLRPNALTYHLGEGEFDIGQYEEMRSVDYVIGAALLIRRDVATALNYLDERYFMYFEETDFCVYARRLGYRVVYWPGAIAIHHENHSLSGAPSRRYFQRYHTSRLKFVYKIYTGDEFLHRFLPAESEWLRHSVRGLHRLTVLAVYLATLPDLIVCLFRNDAITNVRSHG
jgi:GT2 family glycosyltransferase